eukprot:scaffold207_cov409-Prasinococcus_capsulatus_cf.AAC.10
MWHNRGRTAASMLYRTSHGLALDWPTGKAERTHARNSDLAGDGHGPMRTARHNKQSWARTNSAADFAPPETRTPYPAPAARHGSWPLAGLAVHSTSPIPRAASLTSMTPQRCCYKDTLYGAADTVSSSTSSSTEACHSCHRLA